MAKSLVIVESPAKAKTIKRYLGTEYDVEASVGHIVDLSDKTHGKLGVDLDNGFKPDYEVIKGKGKVLDSLRKSAKGKDKVYLATDPDREGEAIAWHISQQLKLGDRAHRVLIREITKEGVLETFRRTEQVNQSKFEAQQARRILDRIVGYKVSPLLWKKIGGALSAGRVQSIALNFVVKREREIEVFNPVEYWKIEARLFTEEGDSFSAGLRSFRGSEDEISNEEQALEIVAAIENEWFVISSVERKKVNLKPPSPFITSTLQREAATKLGFSVKKTMNLAQRLYEGIEIGSEGPVGLITYMRTDSPRLSPRAVDEARDFIKEKYGEEFVPAKPNIQKVSKDAQDAHEAIRVTSILRGPEDMAKFLEKDQLRLYELIWKRFAASQMSAAVDEKTTADISAGEAVFRATGTVQVFAGWRAAAPPPEKKDGEEALLPPLSEGADLKCEEVVPSQHFTKPPPRYNEASLVKDLEKKGIGRPSTYASILSTIQDREYVNKEKKALFPTPLGFAVNDYLVKDFPDIMDEKFTASVEQRLDKIEQGSEKWDGLLHDFYLDEESGLKKRVETAENAVNDVEETDIMCEKCDKPMVVKNRRRGGGEFLSCSGYPECKNASDFERVDGKIVIKETAPPQDSGIACEKCGEPMVIRKRRRDGVEFLACSGYPKCKNASDFERDGDKIIVKQTEKPEDAGISCEKCDKPMVIRKRRRDGAEFLACSGYPKCRNASDFERLENGEIKPIERKKSDSAQKS
ncbi:MAG: type I DNA topoisomerase [Candidatus Mycalebacterium zealandia]|nr:MAG: type I DNA topoisomerase [Candidatus Mycalebacterium zealandia]